MVGEGENVMSSTCFVPMPSRRLSPQVIALNGAPLDTADFCAAFGNSKSYNELAARCLPSYRLPVTDSSMLQQVGGPMTTHMSCRYHVLMLLQRTLSR